MTKATIIVRKYGKKLLKFVLYLVFLALFIKFYFVGEYESFAKGSTTVSKSTQKTEHLDAPLISLCMSPPFKSSEAKKNGVSIPVGFRQIRRTPNVTSYWNLYQDLSYQNGQDFEIKLQVNDNKSDFGIRKFATYRHGLCHLIQHENQLHVENGKLHISITFSKSLQEEDLPAKVKFQLHSKRGWHGMITDDWPEEKPQTTELLIKRGQMAFYQSMIAQINYLYRDGVEDFEQCFLRHILENVDCRIKCFPLIFNIFSPALKPCQTKDKLLCMYKKLAIVRGPRNQCLRLKNLTMFQGDTYFRFATNSNKTSIKINFYSAGDSIKVAEEILVVSTGSFIGSIGGSLGLFLGFSFFSYLATLIDKLL